MFTTFTSCDFTPIGHSKDYCGGSVTPGYLLEDGAAYSRTTYAALFSLIGTAYGVGDGSTTFNVPDSRRRVHVGSGGAGTSTLGNTVGASGGEENHTLSTGEMPVHAHTVSDPGHVHGVSDPGHSHTVERGTGGAGPNGFSVSADSGLTYQTGGAGTGIGINAAGTGISINNAGSGTAHNNLQPSLVVTKMIKF